MIYILWFGNRNKKNIKIIQNHSYYVKFIEHCLDLGELASVDVITETIKEFALLDREFVVRRDGTMLSAGRYMNINRDISLQDGIGGRHLAVACLDSFFKILFTEPIPDTVNV